MTEPRIGVYICGCHGQVSDCLDTDKVRAAAGALPGVAFVEQSDFLCSKSELARMAKSLQDNGADRVLFAGCSGRTGLRFPEDFLGQALRAAGLDEAMFEIANIREQCAWIHEPGDASTAKAVDEVAMAHARLSLDEPRPPAVPIEQRALVVGGGPAGLAAAKDLASMGRDVTLVERGTYLGGRLCQIPFLFQSEKSSGKCVSTCVGPVQARGVLTSPSIDAYTRSTVADIAKSNGNFSARIDVAPRFVNPDLCISCGKCAEVCPETAVSDHQEGLYARKAIDKDFPRALPDTYNILEAFCTKCGDCVPVCPTNAIDLSAKPETVEEEYGAVFLSTGFEHYDLNRLPEYRYNSPDVVTGIEFERMMDEGKVLTSAGETPEHVVFVLCAGSRATLDREGRGVPYCSKTCCGITMKQAERIAQTMFETEVTILYYYDIRTYERAFESMYDTVRRMGIEFVRGNMEEIAGGNGDGLRLRVSQVENQPASSGGEYEFQDGELAIDADMVVLASAQVPRQSSDDLYEKLGVSTDSDGFPMENQPRIFRPTETFVDRVYAVGAASGPKVVQQAVEQGRAAAMAALPVLMSGKKDLPKFVSSIAPEVCIGCRMCETVCPHGAISVSEDGVAVDPAFCQSCGLCAAACPTHAAQVRNHTDGHILAQVDAAFAGVADGDPKIMALLCYWCSYAAADLAGASRMRAPVNYRSTRIRCSSSVNSALIMEMFRRGVDGVIVAGCPHGGCHHIHGNYLTDKRITLLVRLMDQLGLDPARLKWDYIGVSGSQKFVDTVAQMDAKLRGLGPNPLARVDNRLAV
ncbi:MAG: hydrogenase iron-sulfur subunit [Desulfatibacillaceae bacterium]